MTAASRPTYRIGEVVRRSGVTKETIHYYLREGLLPLPHKTSRNAALYGDEHLRRLSLIRSLREEHLLSLKAIKSLLADQSQLRFTPDQLAMLQDLRRHKLDEARHLPPGTRKTTQELARELALSPAELQELRDTSLLTAEQDVAPDSDEAECLRLWTLVRNSGINAEKGFGPRDIAYINDAAKVLLDREVVLFRERLHNLKPSEVHALLHIIIPAINRLVALRHCAHSSKTRGLDSVEAPY
ncbi:MAG: MerR family transcriptional regulator, partial [Paraburkholderia fungorum]|nr:MerR family transcriptional regulator [Paraburkholderia fungorum]